MAGINNLPVLYRSVKPEDELENAFREVARRMTMTRGWPEVGNHGPLLLDPTKIVATVEVQDHSMYHGPKTIVFEWHPEGESWWMPQETESDQLTAPRWHLGFRDRGLGRGDFAVLDQKGDVVIEVSDREIAELIISAVNSYKSS